MNKIKIQEDIIYHHLAKKDIKIIHMADIHFNTNIKEKKLNSIINCINNEKPNYIIITGDTIDSIEITNNEEKIKELFNFFKVIAKNNKIIISLGNHDTRDTNNVFFDELNAINNIYVLDNASYQDEYLYIAGFSLPNNYFYNNGGEESVEELTNFLDQKEHLTKKLPINKIKIALIHSPLIIPNPEVLKRLNEYNIVLSGHTHDGLVPDILKCFFKGNKGIVSPCKKLFPKYARGRVNLNTNNKQITMIISGGVTKLSLISARWLSRFNFIYNTGINRIIIKRKEV